jgi:hypothetical protein
MTRRELLKGTALAALVSLGCISVSAAQNDNAPGLSKKMEDAANSTNVADWRRSMKDVNLLPTFEKSSYSNETVIFTAPSK